MNPLSFYEIEGVYQVERSLTVSTPDPTGFRVCVTGGRDITDIGYVWSLLDTLHNLPTKFGGKGPITELGAGCARGVDDLALRWAHHNDVPWRRYIADWERFGTPAGVMRNEAMLLDFNATLLAVYDGGVGTTDCARKCRKLVKKGLISTEREFYPKATDPIADILKWG